MINGKAILSVDYSDCKEEEIMALASQLMELIFSENKPSLILSIYNQKNVATPRVMRHIEKVTKQVIHLIDKMAIVGLTPNKKIILAGYNLIFKRDFKAFDTSNDAIAYLLKETSI